MKRFTQGRERAASISNVMGLDQELALGAMPTVKHFTAHAPRLDFIGLQFCRRPSMGCCFVPEDFDVISDLRHLVWFLLISVMVSACQPADDPEESGTEPGTDAGEPERGDQSSLPEPDTQQVELDFNDVSILLPPPTSDDSGLAITDLAFDGASVWPDDVFAQYLGIAENFGGIDGEDVVSGRGGSRIDLSAFTDKSVWHVAAIRIDPGAPGLSDDIKREFGQAAQIRLVLQPVTGDGTVHDVAAHMIYNYVSGAERVAGCPARRLAPDLTQFRRIVDDAAAIKSKLAAGEIGGEAIDTDGPLGVHPAADPAQASAATRRAFRDELKGFLDAHLDPSKLGAMAIMGLPKNAPEPWIFLAMAPNPAGEGFVPLPSPAIGQDKFRFAQMLDARRGTSVSPVVRANNLNPITCSFEVDPNNPLGVTSPENANGVSTAELFPNGDAERMREIVSVIADPTRAHFFNTDCVSCHTETRREMDILGTDRVDAPVDPGVLPTELWNVRNFGWFPSFLNGGVFATATRRTAAETEEVVEAINASLKER